MQFEPSTGSIRAVPAEKSSKLVNCCQKFKCGRGQIYGSFDSMMQKSSARRTTQYERSTSPTDIVLAEIRQIPSPSGPQSNSGHFEMSANGLAAKNTEQMEAF
ncbi:MAG: hypothetical protein GY820_43385 [Gammaproteobacteria bacterium]|nr:hypothetical protein [Gammaproteobacteria bacterium]